MESVDERASAKEKVTLKYDQTYLSSPSLVNEDGAPWTTIERSLGPE